MTDELDPLDPATAAAVLELGRAATLADGARPYSEQTLLRLTGVHPGVRHLLVDAACATDGALPEVAGYAQLDALGVAELAVDPAHRRRGHGRALLRRLLDAAGPAGPRVWSHGGHPGAAALAAGAGLVGVRELWRMARPLPVDDEPVVLPPGVTVRTYGAPGDADAWVATNARAFAGHPEQGALTRTDFDARAAQPWFDPAGLFLAERSGALVGFHWTKVHPADPARGTGPAGEIYVLGVDPAGQGGGLGLSLARIGLHHLASLGLGEVFLYVDAANAPAVRVYTRLGFTRTETHVMYGLPPLP